MSLPDDSITAVDYIQSQLALEREARQLMPYDPNSCSYALGSLRQQVFACLTCYNENSQTLSGICYSCSVQCHSKHEIVELFTKRNFSCDCGTSRMSKNGSCRLRNRSKSAASTPGDDIPSSSNIYNHNFKGEFCSCLKKYNPLEEKGNMLQCIFGDVCGEDWFHEECIMGLKPGVMDRTIVKSTKPIKSEDGVNKLDSLAEAGLDAETEANLSKTNVDESDDENEDEDEILPLPGFPNFDDFDGMICWRCVTKYKEAIDQIDGDMKAGIVEHVSGVSTLEERQNKLKGAAIKQEETDEPQIKRRKTDDSSSGYAYSIFLKDYEEGFQAILKENSPSKAKLIKFLQRFQFLVNEDPVYEPPEDDDDDNSSIYDLGSKALSSLPREQAIEGVQAYENIKNKLTQFLKPFAENGKVVTADEIRGFFDNEMVKK